MKPHLWTLPIVELPITSYGFMLTLGFLSGIWLCMRRAARVKADPDLILNLGFVLLFCGVGGARVFYVAHYWEHSFAELSNPWLAAVDITGGGLEFYGGLIGATIGAVTYLLLKRVSLRMYLDIVAPGVMWGLAFGRIGCLLNGCCWGGVCETPTGQKALPWAIRFPYGSGAFVRQWENRQVSVPAEFVFSTGLGSSLVDWQALNMSVEEREGPRRRYAEVLARYNKAKGADPQSNETATLAEQLAAAETAMRKQEGKLLALRAAQRFPSRNDPSRRATVTEIRDLAYSMHSRWVQPTQVYGIINALLLSWVLATVFHRRRRHGVVFGLMLILYPISRIVLELIRVDNPHDVSGLTISQAVSVGMMVVAVGYLVLVYRMCPQRSRRAVPFVLPAPAA